VSWRTAKVAGRPWQDLVFALGEIVFLVALVPLLFTDTRIPLYTGLSTGIMLYLFGLCQLSYRNWITLTLGLTTATIWILLGLGVHV
jgi:hypothetical protein